MCNCTGGCSCSGNATTIPKGSDGADGLNGTFGGYSAKWQFSTSTATGPTSTQLRFNNSTLASVTAIYVSDINNSTIDHDAFLDSLSNSSRFGYVRIFKEFDSNTFWYGQITAITDNGTDHTLTVTYIGSNGTFASGDSLILSFAPAGPVGTAGVEYELRDINTDWTWTAGTNKRTVVISNAESVTTTANRTVTLVPVSGVDNSVSFIFEGAKIGIGFNFSINFNGTIFQLQEGTIGNIKIDCIYNPTYGYLVHVNDLQPTAVTSSVFVPHDRNLVVEYDFATHGGAVGTINLTQVIPKGAILKANEATIETITPLTSGGLATIEVGYAGVNNAFHASTAFSAAPFNAANSVAAPTPAANRVKLTAGTTATVTIGTAALTAGKFKLYIPYIINNV